MILNNTDLGPVELTVGELNLLIDGLCTMDYINTTGRDREPYFMSAKEQVDRAYSMGYSAVHGSLAERLMLELESRIPPIDSFVVISDKIDGVEQIGGEHS